MSHPDRQPRPSGGTVFRPRAEQPTQTDAARVSSMQSTWYISPEKLEQLRGAFVPRRQG